MSDMMKIFNILDYPDIQTAINACEKAGGGTVTVPPGMYQCGSIRLCSNLIFQLEPGAVLLAPDSMEGYIRYPFAWELYSATTPFIYAENAENIRICGGGCIDFNGRAFAIKDKLCIGNNIPQEFFIDTHYDMPPRDMRPNRLVFFFACKDVEITGITLKDSPTWTLVFHDSQFINIHHIRVDNDLRIPNNDGIHCCGCRDVIISNSFFSCGDDCIAITSISDGNLVSERFIISDCIFKSVSAAVRIGFQDSKVRDILLHNCIIHNSNRGISIFAGENGFVENIQMEHLSIDCRIYAGYWWGKGEPLVICSADEKSRIRNIILRDTQIRAENSIIISGVNNSVSEVVLENLRVQLDYGSSRPWFGKEYDLSPHPRKIAPPAEKHIPWLWSEGNSDIHWKNIRHFRAENALYQFETAEVVK